MSDVLEAAELEAPVATEPTENTEEENKNLIAFEIEGFEKDVEIDLEKMPEEVRRKMMFNAVKSYVTNRVSTASAGIKKVNAPWDSYEAAVKNDPLQNLVPKPETERQTVPYQEIVDRAINALYTGEIGKRGKGAGTKAPKDPLNEQLLRTITSEVFAARVAADPNYKYFTAKAYVGNDAMKYIEARIEDAVVNMGMDEKQAREWFDAKYVKPAKIALGLEKLGGKLKDFEGVPL